ncbi:MAG: VCBS repeat-containing protein, partial [Planctomycetota bacterium]|nr:VCBS repeat-containing protein [Planctomycetota bacterium]
LEQTGARAEARDAYLSVTRLDPFLRSAWLGLQRTESRLGRPAEAADALETFERLGRNPRARLAEFRYSRMGPLAMVVLDSTPGPPVSSFALAESFGPSRSVFEADVPSDASLQVVDLRPGDPPLIVIGGGGPERRNLVLVPGNEPGDWMVVEGHPLSRTAGVNCMLFGDLDSNGTVDAVFCRNGPNLVRLQSEAGDWSEPRPLPGPSGDTLAGTIADLDHDGDLDVFCVNRDAPDALLNNNGDGTYRDIAPEAGVAGPGGGSRRVLVADLDLDRDADLVVLRSSPPHSVFLNDRLWRYSTSPAFREFERTPIRAVTASYGTTTGLAQLRALDESGIVSTWSAGATPGSPWTASNPLQLDGHGGDGELDLIDLTGDGLRELVVASGERLELLDGDNRKLGLLEVGDAIGCMSRILLEPSRGSGILTLDHGGRLTLHPASDRRGAYATMSFTGRDDPAQQMRSNTSGIGVRWSARLGSSWQAGATWNSGTSPGQGVQPWPVGMGSADSIDFLEINWPDGVFQTELALARGSHVINEIQRQISSCPLVFLRPPDQADFEFQTDVLGVGGIGYLLAPGVTAPPRPRESLLLPSMPAELRLAEPMEEACYLDHLEVVAFDVPEDCELVLDERLATGSPEASSRPMLVERIVEVQRATNDRGSDVTRALSSHDLEAADPGAVDPRFIGRLSREHVLELEFDEPLDGCDLLLAEGWVEYPYSQTSFAAWQAGARYVPPTLEALAADGTWRVVAREFGYPAGMPRAMALPLPPLPDGCRRLRIRSNLEIYWDRIRLGVRRPGEPEASVLPMESAELAWCGFPRRSTGPQRQPFYDYQRRDQYGDMRHQPGFYTSFGECTPLVTSIDDACAILGPGEELRVRFTDAVQAPPAPGTRRHWVLRLAGWCKDMDLFTVDGERLEPLPARSGGRPGLEARRLMERFNRRFASGR